MLVAEEPALWWIAQDYVGPDGVARTREGIAGSIEATPYAEGECASARERTHAAVREGRLQVLRATRTQLEPIFLLYDADPPVLRPDGEPELRRRARSRRAHAASGACANANSSLDVPLLIADGHHRYETAVAFRREEPTATHTFAVLRLVTPRSDWRSSPPTGSCRASASNPTAG